jgi:hypothetical protein
VPPREVVPSKRIPIRPLSYPITVEPVCSPTHSEQSTTEMLAPRITASSPVLRVRNAIASADYFRDAVGFQYGPEDLYGKPPAFCICHRDGHYLMLAEVQDAKQIKPFWKIKANTPNAYFWVDHADELFEEMRAAGTKIDYTPCTQPYGVREFGIQDLDEHDISFGQIL